MQNNSNFVKTTKTNKAQKPQTKQGQSGKTWQREDKRNNWN